MYHRRADGQVLDFGHCGYVYRGSFVMFDRQTESEWLHATAECMLGPLRGKKLRILPTKLVTWDVWKSLHPATSVLSPRQPWVARREDQPAHDFQDPAARNSLGLNVITDTGSKLYPFSLLAARRVINDRIGTAPIVAVFDRRLNFASAWDREVGGTILEFQAVLTPSGLRLAGPSGRQWNPASGQPVARATGQPSLKPIVAIPILQRRYQQLFPQGQVYVP